MSDTASECSNPADSPVLDLKLLCANGGSVVISSKVFKYNTRSPAIQEIISKLRKEHALSGSPGLMELPVPSDSAAAWDVVWKVMDNSDVGGLTWNILQKVALLADKYQLVTVLQACELFMLKTPGQMPPFTGGETLPDCWIFEGNAFESQLGFLELMCQAKMHTALALHAGQYMPVLHVSLQQLISRRTAFVNMLQQQGLVDGRIRFCAELRRYEQEATRRIISLRTTLSQVAPSAVPYVNSHILGYMPNLAQA